MNSVISRTLTRNVIKNIIGVVIGIIGGYLYYYYIGCTSGGCAITSNPYMSMLWGGIIGYLLFDVFKLKGNQVKEEKDQDSLKN